MPEGKAVQTMFAGIATRYDLANRVLSGGLDILWRRRLVRRVRAHQPGVVVDLASGSGDVAFALQRALGPEVEVTGTDFCQPMLDEAQTKQTGDPLLSRIRFQWADCLDLPFADDSIDVLTIAFGLRNLENRARGLREMHRVLRPGGALLVLEFTQPDRWFRPFYFFYLRHVLPHLATLLTRDKSAYDYLGGSIADFPDKTSLSAEIAKAGFPQVTATGLSASIVAIHEAVKGS
ncbi:MAG: bifunctional demethylmenaquinone methyltransferase/2-methoxy-6-polyprenyl-1,4-benzoquinol methylase UbiE [Verrucomicrobiota bacterium]